MMRQELATACALARASDLRAEQLLVLLKDTWRSLPELGAVPRLDAEALLARVITLCIKQYYRPVDRI